MERLRLSIGNLNPSTIHTAKPIQHGNNAMNAKDQAEFNSILKTANEIIRGQRNQAYGPAERSFDTISKLWSIYLNTCRNGREYITAADVAMMMILLKVARTNDTPTVDSLVDICGYAALAGESIDY